MLGFIENLYKTIYNTSAGKKADQTKELDHVRVYGLPLAYSNLVDPDGRIYRKTILKRMPFVSIQPGTARAAIGNMTPDQKQALESRLKNIEAWCTSGGELTDEVAKKELADAYQSMAEDDQSFPYLLFAGDVKSFQDAYNTLAVRVFSRLDILNSNNDNWTDNKGILSEFKTAITTDITPNWNANGWLNFYLDKSTSISESGSNSYDNSMFSQLAKKVTAISAEIYTLLGDEAGSSKGSLDTGIFSKLSDAMKGNQVIFPKVWQDSTFSRGYNLNFKFHSPYGDPMSIWRHVYTPFLLLLTLALPRQSGVSSYHSPFMVRVDCPGMFTIDCGIIGNISIRKGDEGWNEGGLPLSIDVTLDVEDIYPQLVIAKNPAILNLNFSLAAYIDSMTGISYVETLSGGTITHGIRSMLSSLINSPISVANRVETAVIGKIQNVNGWLANLIR